MKRIIGAITTLVAVSGCGAPGGALPSYDTSGTPIQYARSLLRTTSDIGINRVLADTETLDLQGHRLWRGTWCLDHPEVSEPEHITREFRSYCDALGGVLDGRLCRDDTNPDDVFFAMQVLTQTPCLQIGGPPIHSVRVDVVEPEEGLQDRGYLSALSAFGYMSRAQMQQAQARRAREQVEMEMRAREMQRRREAVPGSSVGTRICRDGILNAPAGQVRGTVIAQLDGFADNRAQIRFRVLGYESPSLGPNLRFGTDPLMGSFQVTPGLVFWDRASNWYVC